MMKSVKYSFSSVQVNLPDDLSKKVIAWGKKHIPDDVIFRDPTNPGFGRENEIHITVLYGIHSKSSAETRRIVKTEKPFNIRLGRVSIFSNDVFDVVKLEVRSSDLHKLNKKFCDNVEYTNKFPVYTPHVTIAYVKPGKGKLFVGDSTFEGKTFSTDHIVFSSKEGGKEKVKFEESLKSFKTFIEGCSLE